MFQSRRVLTLLFCLLPITTGLLLSLSSTEANSQPTPSATPTPSETSAPDANLTALEQALTSKNYREASRLTSLLVLDLAGKRSQGYLKAEDTRKLACQALQDIDQRWLKASDGYFGLSVQASIWRGVRGQTYEDTQIFQSIVGWRGSSTFSIAEPRGHLPFRPATTSPEGIMEASGGGWIQTISNRLDTCAKE
ncbi:MAG: GUN4 domain-containing protein [Oscillatoriophycideae cyanobacterium NC_groundwater_1537_Pr4_S-0.65um_50_18]|nr:GUN4 domain-containing protein [Oscillatoriophycideae cyanobacterium NC_groundwater_1537_Pr4_S-0.65um_50_18]